MAPPRSPPGSGSGSGSSVAQSATSSLSFELPTNAIPRFAMQSTLAPAPAAAPSSFFPRHHHRAFPPSDAALKTPLLLPRIVLPMAASSSAPSTLGRLLPTLSPELRKRQADEPDVATSRSSAAHSMMALLQRPEATGHKRSFSSGDEEDEDDEDEDDSGDRARKALPSAWTPDAHKHKKAKSRKPTYLVRKEEKDLLQLQVQQLQAQVDFLRERSGIVDWQSREFQVQQKKIVNDILRESVRNQQLSVFSAQSVVSELMTLGERCPIDTHIRLSRDWPTRRETLMALKAQKLHDAQRLLEKRTQFMDPSRERREDSCFMTENGDYCSIAFQSVPLTTARCVKQVYDTLHHRVQHLESSVGEAMGIVLTCDGDDNWDKTILHRRLVHSSVRDVLSESNYVVFSEFVDDECKKGQWSRDKAAAGASGKELGIFVLDYVDEDELFPYRSGQCVRHDVTGVISLRAVPCKHPAKSGQENGSMVVMTKWLMLRIRHNSTLNVSELKLQELKARIQQVGNALVQNVRESAALPGAGSDLPKPAAAVV